MNAEFTNYDMYLRIVSLQNEQYILLQKIHTTLVGLGIMLIVLIAIVIFKDCKTSTYANS